MLLVDVALKVEILFKTPAATGALECCFHRCGCRSRGQCGVGDDCLGVAMCHVALQVVDTGEPLATEKAFVWAVLTVREQVTIEVHLAREGTRTVRAVEYWAGLGLPPSLPSFSLSASLCCIIIFPYKECCFLI